MNRTDAQKRAFAMECLEIEKTGGDVLGYIEENWPSYTPRATWYRLQRAWLGRKAHQLTEGKPKEKGVTAMGKMMDLARGCLEAYGRGEKVYDYLASQGSKNPSAYWYQIKATVKLKDPDLYEQLSVIRTDIKKKETSFRKEAETVFFGGKEYEKMGSPSPTCCQPARPSGVTVPDVLPDEPVQNSLKNPPLNASLKVCGVKGAFGRYEITEIGNVKFMTFIVRHQLTQTESEITFPASSWKHILKEIPEALTALGLT